MSEKMRYLSFCAWLISYNIMPSSSIHIAAYDRISFLYDWIIFQYTFEPYLFYPFICGWTFWLIAYLVNSVAINVNVQASLCYFRFISLGNTLKSRTSGSYCSWRSSFFFFRKFSNGYIILHSCWQYVSIPLSRVSFAFFYYNCGFWFAFTWWLVMLTIFHTLGHSYVFL
jgi:hypothetical protein